MALSFSPSKIVTDKLITYLDAGNIKSYPKSGSDFNDLKSTNNSTFVNNPTFVNEKLGGIELDGVDDYIDLSNTFGDIIGGLNPKYTISFWIKFNTLTEDVSYTLFSKYGPGTFPDSFGSDRQLIVTVRKLSSRSDVNFGIDFIPYFKPILTSFVPWARVIRNTTTPLLTDNIYNITISYDGSINTNDGLDRVEYYIDSVKENKSLLDSFNALQNNHEDVPTNRVSLGAIYNTTPSGFGDMTIYSFSIYNKILSQSEVIQNYNALKYRFE